MAGLGVADVGPADDEAGGQIWATSAGDRFGFTDMRNSAAFGVMFVAVAGVDVAFGLAGTVDAEDEACGDNDCVSIAMDGNCVVLLVP